MFSDYIKEFLKRYANYSKSLPVIERLHTDAPWWKWLFNGYPRMILRWKS